MSEDLIILGGGMTGLAAGLASGLPVYEAEEVAGGICASYYRIPGDCKRLPSTPRDEEAYRFEVGGGHWLWGGDPLVLRFIRSLTAVKSYARRSAVYLPSQDLFIPYPIQNHLRYLGPEVAMQILREMVDATLINHPAVTMAEWLQAYFGPTLCRLFFDPFHELYTAGLWQNIAAQDASKSPVNLSLAIQGAFDKAPQAIGYNVNFLYPVGGLNALAMRMAQQCHIHYGRRVVKIDVKEKTVLFADGSTLLYTALLCTLPLNTTLQMAGLTVSSKLSPFTSVMVVNIGARKGPRCPQEHWLYIPQSKAGFHRVGFYSNVDPSFLPASARNNEDRISIYVERAYPGGQKPDEAATQAFCQEVVQELQAWEWIADVEVVDPTWINTAYTWFWPNSQWTQEAMAVLEAHDIYQVGRYARWASRVTDQGIAESLREGLFAGASFQGCT
jgi:protoporphyrinogen oxidase